MDRLRPESWTPFTRNTGPTFGGIRTRIGQVWEHDVAVKMQHGVATVLGRRRGGIFPDRVVTGTAPRRPQRCGHWPLEQALKELACEWRIDYLRHGVLHYLNTQWTQAKQTQPSRAATRIGMSPTAHCLR